MRRMKQWAAIALSVTILGNLVPVYGAQPDTGSMVDIIGAEEIISTEEEQPHEEAVQETESAEKEYSQEDTQEAESTGAALPEIDDEQEQTGDIYDDESEPAGTYSLDIEAYYYYLQAGEKAQIGFDTDIPISELSYEISDPAAVTVSQTGQITAVSAGTAGSKTVTITISWQNPRNEYDRYFVTCTVYVENTISLDKTSYTIYTGQKTAYQLTAKTKPAGSVSWKSSKTAVATVDSNGKITPKKAGTTTITATANGVSATCTVTVKKPSFDLKKKATLYLQNPETLGATAAPETTIKWTSSNKTIATVNAKGVVTPKKTGTVTITATAHGITKTCKVTIEKPSIEITSSYPSWVNSKIITAVYQGSSTQLYASAKPSTTVKWSSSNKKVAKVDKNGVVTGVKAGTAKITASIPGAKATYSVKVVKNPYKLNFTSRTMMVGNTATLYVKNLTGNESPYFSLQDYNGVAGLSTDQNACTINAYEKGTTSITARMTIWQDGMTVCWNQTCTVKVIDTGISEQQFSIAKGKTKKLKVISGEGTDEVQSVVWSSSASKVASVNSSTGVVTGKKAGTAKITASVTYTTGKKKTYTTDMRVSDPKLKTSTIVAARYGRKYIDISGINAYSNMTWKSKSTSVLSVTADGRILPVKKGKTTVTVTVDGKALKCTVYVSDPKLKTSYAALAPSGTAKINVNGLAAKSKVTYKSSNKSVATVDKSGKITAKKGGRSEITIDADGQQFTYLVEVASQTALNARAQGKSIIDRSTYSQAKRMTEGYYDCSSLVFRAYGKNTAMLGGISSWAPTAAAMAQHMVKTGKVLAWKSVPVEQLRPGDLIFYGGQSNGRYLGIYHVSMYYGDGDRLEKPLYSYYESSSIVMVARPAP